MDQLEKIFIGLIGIILIGFILHAGYYAWFHPDELQIILIQDAQRRSSWPFSKEWIVELTKKYGVTASRVGTVLLVIVILIVEAIVFL